jgi:uncharacterized protein
LKFRVEEIPVEGREESFLEDEASLNDRAGGESSPAGLHFTDPIRVRVVLSRSGSLVLVKSRIEAPAKCLCARCLEPLSLTLTSQYQTSLKPKPAFPLPEEVELTREDLETDFYEGEEIDLTPLVQDQVLLAIPPKVVCREECRGLCQVCGKNLNREACQCSGRTVDPRLEALRNFRVY